LNAQINHEKYSQNYIYKLAYFWDNNLLFSKENTPSLFISLGLLAYDSITRTGFCKKSFDMIVERNSVAIRLIIA